MSRRWRAALLLVLATACGRAGGSPRLEVLAGTVGEVRRGDQVEARFDIRNAGGGRLHVRAIVPDCACRADVLGSEVLAAGARTTVAARCRVVPGASEVRRLRVRSNDPERPETVLAVRAPARDTPTRPPALSFGYVRVGTTAIREIVVRGGGLTTRAPELALEAGARGDGGRTYRVRFTPRTPGVLRAVLDAPGGAPVAVSGVGFAAVAAYPAEVRIPSAIAEDLPPIVLKRMSGAPLAVARLDLPAGVAGEVATIVPGEQVRLVLRSLGAASDDGTAIRVHVAGGEPIVIPVRRSRPPAVSEASGNRRG